RSRTRALMLLASVVLMGSACSHGPSHPASGHAGFASPARTTVPRTHQHRNGGPLADAPAGLVRPLHFPSIAGGPCPASHGDQLSNPIGGSMALGAGPVRVGIDNAGDPRKGTVHPAGYQGWLALKTHFVSLPSYRGPFLVRARRLDRPGPIALGPTPTQAGPLVVPAGAAANAAAGWREFPYFTFVRSPGCYAWQIDGLTFSDIVVVHVLSKYHA
ncbi:MAG: hypothetical protein QOG21_322, partial [Actinomycetota bacterium]|nr:hypothetical protein [Actinomycetota bacterium]